MKKSWRIDIDCPNCAAKLEAALRTVPGVEDVTVNYVQKRVTLTAADDAFEAVTQSILAKAAEVEPDATIFVEETAASAHTHGEHCGCGEHHHDHDEHSSCGGHDHDHHDHGHEHGHNHSHAHEETKGRTLLLRVGAAVVLTIAGFLTEGLPLLSAACFLLAYLCVGYDVLLSALRNIRRGEIFDENFLMSVASIGALCMGEFAEAIAVMALYQVGEYFQDKAVDKSRASITALMDIRPDYANRLVDGAPVRVKPEEVAVGELILVKPGEKLPLDGVVTEGTSSLDTSALTGESLPRDVREGDSVLSGCVNLSGVLTVRVSASYGESTVAKILTLVEESGDAKASTERFITRFSRVYTPLVCLAAVLLAVVPSLFDGQWQSWIYRALTFLVISCPCALVISVPLTFFSGIGGASKRGVLVKGANHLEMLAQLDTVAFDKTGTLTRGVFTVTTVSPVGMPREALLDAAAHAEIYSDHPISRSLREAYGAALDASRVADAEEIAGHGIRVQVDGREVLAGNDRLMALHHIDCAQVSEVGTVVHVAADGAYAGYIVIADVIKDGAVQAVQALKDAGVARLAMLTGDRETVAADIAQRVGLTEYRAGLLPEGKVTALEGLLGQEHHVAFVGDGINDAPVLRRADLGIAMGGMGSDAAIEAADVVLMDDQIGKVALAVRLAKRTMRIARQNIVFALGVKAIVMLLGAVGIANMWLAVFADVGVAMLAILNAMRAMRAE
ncbi:MAG: cadmium-translocating P-type ATPase [Clostridia bacterium]|nr:cadmium-translocating P-type ATPase [Clostridia bacterium]